jgi:hypothetical protein
MQTPAAAAATLYISADLETVGDNLWDLTIINAGFVAYEDHGAGDYRRVGGLSINMIPGTPDPKQVEWWNSTPELAATYASFQHDAKAPAVAMMEIRDWVQAAVRRGPYAQVSWVACPTIFDGSFLYAYWMRFLPSEQGARGTGLYHMIDVRSYGAGRLGCSLHQANKTRAFVEYMPDPARFAHTHTGIDDAEEQIWLFFNLKDLKKRG